MTKVILGWLAILGPAAFFGILFYLWADSQNRVNQDLGSAQVQEAYVELKAERQQRIGILSQETNQQLTDAKNEVVALKHEKKELKAKGEEIKSKIGAAFEDLMNTGTDQSTVVKK